MRGPNRWNIPVARKLRRDPTNAESKLWAELRNRQLGNFKFVRQEPIGAYVADFVCREKRLVIEVDGATHSTDEEIRHDAARTAFLERLGYRVIRFQNDDVYNAMDGVVQTILMALGQVTGMPLTLIGARSSSPRSPRFPFSHALAWEKILWGGRRGYIHHRWSNN